MYVDRAHTHAAVEAVSAVAAAEQPEGWRFVPDTILPGYQWAPQWVPARTPTVHWGPIRGKAVGGPNYSSAQQYSAETPKTRQRSAGSKSTGDKSLLCYDGPRNECVARLFVRAMKTRCVGEPTQSIDVEKRVGESDDKSVMNRQRQGTLPRYDHHLCSDSSCWKSYREIVTQSSYDEADNE